MKTDKIIESKVVYYFIAFPSNLVYNKTNWRRCNENINKR